MALRAIYDRPSIKNIYYVKMYLFECTCSHVILMDTPLRFGEVETQVINL